MAYLDLDELPALLDGRLLWSARAPGARALPPRATTSATRTSPLADAVRDARRASAPASRPAGPVRLLTSLRYLGHCFNPVSFYYCFDRAGERARGGRRRGHEHAVGRAPRLRARRARRRTAPCTRRVDKAFHVSPFMGMDHDVRAVRVTPPGRDAARAHRRAARTARCASTRRSTLDRGAARRAAALRRGRCAASRRRRSRVVVAHLRPRRAAEAQGRAVLRATRARRRDDRPRWPARSCHRLLRRIARRRARAASSATGRRVRFGALGRPPLRATRRGPRPRASGRALLRGSRRPRRGLRRRPVGRARPRRARSALARAQRRRGSTALRRRLAPLARAVQRAARRLARNTPRRSRAATSPPTTTSATTSSRSSSTSG